MNKTREKNTGTVTRIVLIISIAVLTASIAYNNFSGGSKPGKAGPPSAAGGQSAGRGGSSNETETVFFRKS